VIDFSIYRSQMLGFIFESYGAGRWSNPTTLRCVCQFSHQNKGVIAIAQFAG